MSKKQNMDIDIQEGRFDIVLEKIAEDAAPIESDEELKRERELQVIRHADERLRAEVRSKNAELEELRIDRELKKQVANKVFIMLMMETMIILIILFLQGFKLWGFAINDTTLNIFLPATILQISSMAIIITRYLFSPRYPAPPRSEPPRATPPSPPNVKTT